MFLGYGLSIASSTYCLTFFFSEHSMAQVFDSKNCAVSIWDYAQMLNLFFCISAECCPLGTFFHRAHSYGYIFHNGAYRVNSTSQFSSQGWNICSSKYLGLFVA